MSKVTKGAPKAAKAYQRSSFLILDSISGWYCDRIKSSGYDGGFLHEAKAAKAAKLFGDTGRESASWSAVFKAYGHAVELPQSGASNIFYSPR